MSRSAYNYTQLAFGVCGHIVQVWPQISGVGGKDPVVVCDDCTSEYFGTGTSDELAVWVRLREEKKPKKTASDDDAEVAASKPKKTTRKKLRCSLCTGPHFYTDCPLMTGQGTLDGA